VSWLGYARAGREYAFPAGVQAGLFVALVLAFLTGPWSKLHLLWCFPVAYFAGLYIPMAIARLRITRALPPMELRKDSEWRAIEGLACRVTDFAPFSSVENGRVVAPNRTDPHASVMLECVGMPMPVKGFVTHRVDFIHLWAAFVERGVSDGEEVMVFWTRSHYKHRYMRLLWRVLPKMWVRIYPKGSLEMIERYCDPDHALGLGEVEAAARAMLPIAEWKPDQQ
jgi:hypothetical protein